jgi:hypothetical protein
MEMGGMFTVVKVREGLAAGDYKDPGWYQRPQGTVAFEWQGEPPAPATGAQSDRSKAVKPALKGGHGGH